MLLIQNQFTVVNRVCEQGCCVFSTVTFMQDGGPSHTATPVKAFLIHSFGEDKIITRGYRFPLASLVSRTDTGRFLVMGIFKIRGISIWSIQSVGAEGCDTPSGVYMGPTALCRCWIYDTPAICYPLWWCSWTHTAVISGVISLFICIYFFDLCVSAQSTCCFFSYFFLSKTITVT